MRRQRTKKCEDWRCRREQYLRESGRQVDLIEDSTNWTVIVGGRTRASLDRDRGTRLFPVKESESMFALSAKSSGPAA